MVTLSQLKAQKKRILARKDLALKKQEIEFEKIGLQKEIKKLQRSPATNRNIKLAKRTGRGFKILSKKIGSAAIRQGKRIRDQQLRDEAALRKSQSPKQIPKQKILVTKTITGKGKKKKIKISRRIIKPKKLKTGQKLSKIKEGGGFNVFSNLDF